MGKAKQTITVVKTTRVRKSTSNSGNTSPKGGNPYRCPTCGKYTNKP